MTLHTEKRGPAVIVYPDADTMAAKLSAAAAAAAAAEAEAAAEEAELSAAYAAMALDLTRLSLYGDPLDKDASLIIDFDPPPYLGRDNGTFGRQLIMARQNTAMGPVLVAKEFDQLISFTRTSTATYVNSTGNVVSAPAETPRFDYDPVTLQPRGLLIEEQRTNLLTYSEDWTNAAWSKTNITVTAAATTSPDGTADAQKLEATATAATSIITPTTTVAATAATFSVYVKQGTGATTANIFTLRNVTSATNLIRGTLDYSTGAFTYTTGSTGVTVTNAGNGWWRVTMTATSGITSGDTIRGYVGFDGGSQTAGDHLFAWGAQLEAGSFATSYIPTVASQVTRTADQASIVAPNFAPWYNQSEGTFVVEVVPLSPPAGSANTLFLEVNNGTSQNRNPLMFATSSGAAHTQYRSGGSYEALLSSAASYFAAGVLVKIAAAYKANDFATSFSGGAPVIDTMGAVAANATQMNIGFAYSGPTEGLNGHIRRISYYPTRLSNAQLQALSA